MLTRRRDPFVTFSDLQSEMDRLFHGFPVPRGTAETKPNGNAGVLAWTPAIEISERNGGLMVEAELPGVDPEKIDVSVDGDLLTITGHKEEVRESEEDNVFHSERRYGSFTRRVTLPAEVDPEDVKASFKNGVLRIRLAKRPEAQAKRIPVSTED